jgi:hypothetical protein
MSINSFFNTVSVSRYSRPITVTRDFYVNLRVEVAAVSRKRYGVEKTVDTHNVLINAIKVYVCLQEI